MSPDIVGWTSEDFQVAVIDKIVTLFSSVLRAPGSVYMSQTTQV